MITVGTKGTKLLTVVLESYNGTDVYRRVYLVEVDARVADVKEAMRRAVKQYLATDEGSEVEKEFEVFTWSNAFDCIPIEFWERNGIKVIRQINYSPDIILSDDEDLRQ